MTGVVPDVRLNNGDEHPAARLRRLPGARRRDRARGARRARGRLPQHRHRRALRQRGRASGAAIASSGMPRDELFVTTKLWNDDQGHDSTLRGLRREPAPARPGLRRPLPDPLAEAEPGPLRRDLARLREARTPTAGPARSACPTSRSPTCSGCSTRPQVVPAVNQVELHPQLQQEPLRALPRRARHRDRGVEPARAGPGAAGVRRSSELARRHGRTPAQVVLRWHLQLGNVVIPKSTTPSRIRENIDVFDFELDDADMAALAGLEAGERLGPDPDERDTRPRKGFSSAGGRWVPGGSTE